MAGADKRVRVSPAGTNPDIHVDEVGAAGGTASFSVDVVDTDPDLLVTVGTRGTGAMSVQVVSGSLTGASGGGAGGFSPDELDNMEVWFDADAMTGFSDSDPVATWSDESDNGMDATQATSERQPVYKTSILNSKPVVRFDGANDMLVTSNFSSALSEPVTVFVVAKYDNLDADASFIVSDGDSNRFYAENFWKIHNEGSVVLGSQDDGDWHVFAVVWDSTDALYIDGALDVSGNAGSGTMSKVTIGNSSSLLFPFGGDIAEVIVYSDLLTTDELNDVGDYLADKYALTWAGL